MTPLRQEPMGSDAQAVVPRARGRRTVYVISWLVGLGLVALSLGFVGFALQLKTEESPPERHADGLVVLTGGADRVSDAIELLANGQADRLLITGVNPLTSPASLARRLPKIRTLVECCVTFGYQALNTNGNAWETAQWVKAHHIRSLIVVTSNYHMPRALAEIGHAVKGVDLLAYPVIADRAGLPSWRSDLHQARLILSEYFKYVFVVARLTLMPEAADAPHTIVATGQG